MSEGKRSRQERAADYKLFNEIIDAGEIRDAGIASFEKKMRDAEKQIMKRFAETSVFDDELLRELGDELNDEWEYDECYAMVSGRVYLSDEDLEVFMPDEWGEPLADGEDEKYYVLDQVQLCSRGIDIVPVFDGEVLERVDVAYVFSPIDDDDEGDVLEALTAFRRDLSVHEYSQPTLEEAERRLAQRWPEQADVIDMLILPDVQSALPQRLDALTRRLQLNLRDSEDFRGIAELVVNERLAFDESLPYAITLAEGGSFKVFVGDDLEDPLANEQWLSLDVKEPFQILAYYPEVKFVEESSGVISVAVHAEVFSVDEGANGPEYVMISPEAIASFFSTRARRSLAELAINQRVMRDAAVLSEEVFTGPRMGAIEITQRPEDTRSAYERHLQRLEKMQQYLDTLVERIQRISEYVYPTPQSAAAATRAIIEEFDVHMKAMGESLGDYNITVGGGSLYRVRRTEPATDSSDGSSYTYGVNTEEMVARLQAGDVLEGRIAVMSTHAEAVVDDEDGDGEVIGYRPHPLMYLDVNTDQWQALDQFGIPLVSLGVQERAVVLFDETINIQITEYDATQRMYAHLKALSEEYGNDSLVRTFHRLRGAIGKAQSDFIALKNVKLLRSLNTRLAAAVEAGKRPEVLIRCLEDQFIGEALKVTGTAIENSHLPTQRRLSNEVAEYAGAVIDVRYDMEPYGIVFVLGAKDGTATFHIPLSTITACEF